MLSFNQISFDVKWTLLKANLVIRTFDEQKCRRVSRFISVCGRLKQAEKPFPYEKKAVTK